VYIEPWDSNQQSPWCERAVSTYAVPGTFIRLCESTSTRYPKEIWGREPKFRVGLWLSERHRPLGHCKQGAADFKAIAQMYYVPADVEWVLKLEKCSRVGQSICCDFDVEVFKQVTGIDADDNTSQIHDRLSAPSQRLLHALWSLRDELKAPGFAQSIAVEAMTRLVMVEIGRSAKALPLTNDSTNNGKLAAWELERIRSYVDSAEPSALSVTAIAEVCGVSASHLRRVFKPSVGIGIGAYVKKLRIERARDLLSKRRLSMQQIAFKLGFANGSSFSNAFTREVGMSPRQYRKQSIR
jgi:AraC-like DNA-binding protein